MCRLPTGENLYQQSYSPFCDACIIKYNTNTKYKCLKCKSTSAPCHVYAYPSGLVEGSMYQSNMSTMVARSVSFL